MVGSSTKLGGYALAASFIASANAARPMNPQLTNKNDKVIAGGPSMHNRLNRKLIAGGRDLRPGEAPWLVALNQLNATTGRQQLQCGATLITPIVVLTAAHCSRFGGGDFHNLTSVDTSRFLINDDIEDFTRFDMCPQFIDSTQEVEDCKDDQAYLVANPDFNSNPSNANEAFLDNDFALIFLPTPVNVTCVPLCCEGNGFPLPPRDGGASVDAIGWGNTANRFRPNEPNKMTTTIVNNEQCAAAYSGTSEISENHLCTVSSGGNATCLFDSGGPGMFGECQAGITSWGDDKACGEMTRPNVFARVSEGCDWICETICRFTDQGRDDPTGKTNEVCNCREETPPPTPSPTPNPTVPAVTSKPTPNPTVPAVTSKPTPNPTVPAVTSKPTPNPTVPAVTSKPTPNPTVPAVTSKPTPASKKPTSNPTPASKKPTSHPTKWQAPPKSWSSSSSSSKSSKGSKGSKSDNSKDDGGWWGHEPKLPTYYPTYYPTYSPTDSHHGDWHSPSPPSWHGGHSSSKSSKSTKGSKSTSSGEWGHGTSSKSGKSTKGSKSSSSGEWGHHSSSTSSGDWGRNRK